MNAALIVLGMHRSGTSALTGVLSMAGADPGPSLMPAAEENNPAGFWEHREIVAIHERLLAAIGASWDDERPLPENWWRLHGVTRFRDELTTVLQRDFASSQLWLLKDPRLCRLLPLWLEIIQELGAKPNFIICLRHPIEVARSLARRDGIQEERACLLWLEHLTESVRWTRGHPRIVATYEELLVDWRTMVQRITESFSVSLAIDKVAAEKIDAFLKPNLKHHHHDQDKLSGDGALSRLAVVAYEIATYNNATQLTEGFASITEETAQRARFVAPWATEIFAMKQRCLSAEMLSAQIIEDNAALQSEITRIKSTFSWQITKPLRFLAFLWRRLLDLTMALVALSRISNPLNLIRAALRILLTRGPVAFARALGSFIQGNLTYAQWVDRNDTLSDADLMTISQHIVSLKSHPLISILMPVCNSPEVWLRRAIESVRGQLYPHWELCVSGNASTQSHLWSVLEEYARLDDRIHIVRLEQIGSISAVSNSCLELAQGEFVTLLDHDDELAPHALYMVATALEENPWLDLIYSDEDKIDGGGRRFEPYFKPDWNPDLFMAQNIVSRLGVYRTMIVHAVGGFHESYEGSQDWDLALRVNEAIPSSHIYHVPHVLYHKRYALGLINQKIDICNSAKNVVDDYWRRQGVRVQVEPLGDGNFRTVFSLPDPPPLVSIIIPTRNGLALLQRCLEGLFNNTNYPAMEIIVVDNCSDDPATLTYLAGLANDGRIRRLGYDAPFNFSAINNMAVTHAHGELICLLNNDVEPIGAHWLREMVSQGLRPEIGVVGAMLYYPNDTIQHAGTLLNGVAASHLYQGHPRGSMGVNNRARLVQNLSAVTAACLVVRKVIWDEVGGMDEINLTVAFNDVDFCLKVRQQGYRNLWTPFAELYHHESVSRGRDNTHEKRSRFQREIAYIQRRWGNILRNDPAWNPNLSLDGSRPRPAQTSRSDKPWRQFEAGH